MLDAFPGLVPIGRDVAVVHGPAASDFTTLEFNLTQGVAFLSHDPPAR